MPKGVKTGGRTKGTPNKFTGSIKEMVEQALSNAGGVEYLTEQASENPVAFLGLVGKLLPRNVELNANVTVSLEELVLASMQPKAESADVNVH